jgi:hypothetical protein
MRTPPALQFRFFSEKTDSNESPEPHETEPPRSSRHRRLDARRTWLEAELEVIGRNEKSFDAA